MASTKLTNTPEALAEQAKAIGAVPIQGEPGYFVRPDGRFFSTGRGSFRELRTYRNNRVYYISCGFGPKTIQRRTYNAAWIVLTHHVPNPNNFHQFIHLDRDPSNLRADNLAWVERSLLFARNNLTIEDVAAIEKLHGDEPRKEIAARYSIPLMKITEIWEQARRKGRITTDHRGYPLQPRTARSA